MIEQMVAYGVDVSTLKKFVSVKGECFAFLVFNSTEAAEVFFKKVNGRRLSGDIGGEIVYQYVEESEYLNNVVFFVFNYIFLYLFVLHIMFYCCRSPSECKKYLCAQLHYSSHQVMMLILFLEIDQKLRRKLLLFSALGNQILWKTKAKIP